MFQIGDLCLAQMGNSIPWPAKITNQINDNLFQVYFYGSHNTANIAKKRICEYTKTNIQEKIPQSLIKRNLKLQTSLWEIENDPDLTIAPESVQKIIQLTKKIDYLEIQLNRCSFKMNTNTKKYLCVNLSKHAQCVGDGESMNRRSVTNMKFNDWNAEVKFYELTLQRISLLKDEIKSIKQNNFNKPKLVESIKFFVGDLVLAKRVKTRPYWPGRVVSVANNSFKVYFYSKKCKMVVSGDQLFKFSKERLRNLLVKNCSKDLIRVVDEIDQDDQVVLSIREKQLLDYLRSRFDANKSIQGGRKKNQDTTFDTSGDLDSLKQKLEKIKSKKKLKAKEIKLLDLQEKKLEERINTLESEERRNLEREESDEDEDRDESYFLDESKELDENEDEDEKSEEDSNLELNNNELPEWCQEDELKRRVELQIKSEIDFAPFFKPNRAINIDELFKI